MPTIGRIGSFDVMIFRNDHDPPHFHVIAAEFSVKFTIADLELLSSKGRIRRRDIRDQTRWALLNLEAILRAAGATLDDVVKTTVYLKEGTDTKAMNEEYQSHFREPRPARSSVFVSQLKTPEMLIEIEVVATLG